MVEQPNRRKTFSKQTLAMLATAWTLLFSACSNNPSSWKDYEKKQTIKLKINKQEQELKSAEKEFEKLKDRRIKNALRYNKKVDEYNLIKATIPDAEENAEQRLNNLEQSMIQLLNRITELDKEIAKNQRKTYKLEWKLINNSVDAAWLWVSGRFEKIEVNVR